MGDQISYCTTERDENQLHQSKTSQNIPSSIMVTEQSKSSALYLVPEGTDAERARYLGIEEKLFLTQALKKFEERHQKLMQEQEEAQVLKKIEFEERQSHQKFHASKTNALLKEREDIHRKHVLELEMVHASAMQEVAMQLKTTQQDLAVMQQEFHQLKLKTLLEPSTLSTLQQQEEEESSSSSVISIRERTRSAAAERWEELRSTLELVDNNLILSAKDVDFAVLTKEMEQLRVSLEDMDQTYGRRQIR